MVTPLDLRAKFRNHGRGGDRPPRGGMGPGLSRMFRSAEQECGPTLWVETFAEELEKVTWLARGQRRNDV